MAVDLDLVGQRSPAPARSRRGSSAPAGLQVGTVAGEDHLAGDDRDHQAALVDGEPDLSLQLLPAQGRRRSSRSISFRFSTSAWRPSRPWTRSARSAAAPPARRPAARSVCRLVAGRRRPRVGARVDRDDLGARCRRRPAAPVLPLNATLGAPKPAARPVGQLRELLLCRPGSSRTAR